MLAPRAAQERLAWARSGRGPRSAVHRDPQTVAADPRSRGAYLFSPPAGGWSCSGQTPSGPRSAKRRTGRPRQAQARKRKAKPKRGPRDCYDKGSYPQAVKRTACEKAGIRFNPYALRHGRKMDLVRTVGSDAARAVLGQKSIDATEHYGEIDVAHALDVMKRMG